jgi:2'-5' RNA ligase
MKNSIRAFWAFDFPRGIIQDIVSYQNKLKKELPSLKWVKDENIHLTVHFLGNVESSSIEPMIKRIEPIINNFRSVNYSFGPLGVFPSWSMPKVLWLGLKGDLSFLRDFHASSGKALEEMGIKIEDRSFNPHITLARINVQKDINFAKVKDYVPAGSTSFQLAGLSLYSSELTPDGPAYKSLYNLPLNQ